MPKWSFRREDQAQGKGDQSGKGDDGPPVKKLPADLQTLKKVMSQHGRDDLASLIAAQEPHDESIRPYDKHIIDALEHLPQSPEGAQRWLRESGRNDIADVIRGYGVDVYPGVSPDKELADAYRRLPENLDRVRLWFRTAARNDLANLMSLPPDGNEEDEPDAVTINVLQRLPRNINQFREWVFRANRRDIGSGIAGHNDAPRVDDRPGTLILDTISSLPADRDRVKSWFFKAGRPDLAERIRGSGKEEEKDDSSRTLGDLPDDLTEVRESLEKAGRSDIARRLVTDSVGDAGDGAWIMDRSGDAYWVTDGFLSRFPRDQGDLCWYIRNIMGKEDVADLVREYADGPLDSNIQPIEDRPGEYWIHIATKNSDTGKDVTIGFTIKIE